MRLNPASPSHSCGAEGSFQAVIGRGAGSFAGCRERDRGVYWLERPYRQASLQRTALYRDSEGKVADNNSLVFIPSLPIFPFPLCLSTKKKKKKYSYCTLVDRIIRVIRCLPSGTVPDLQVPEPRTRSPLPAIFLQHQHSKKYLNKLHSTNQPSR